MMGSVRRILDAVRHTADEYGWAGALIMLPFIVYLNGLIRDWQLELDEMADG